ncbi:uncharacterized protein LOC128657260 [Bombina bombina]|uniref:uncharacterized protein LOC128657260 n=1 Tax=Bombina bombina TaxID=8345 RepID=UPI00235A6852|nr:uncharacterized protein LOC128657260 [Bombina bombina]
MFQHFINNIFRDLLDMCMVVYLDNSLIYSDNEEDHIKHVRWVLGRLRTHQLYAKPEKCLFHVTQISFLGYHISSAGLKMEDGKVEAIQNWPIPTNTKEVQRFLGFANVYRKFIKDFSTIVKLLTKLTGSQTPFKWNSQAEEAFNSLKTSFTTIP